MVILCSTAVAWSAWILFSLNWLAIWARLLILLSLNGLAIWARWLIHLSSSPSDSLTPWAKVGLACTAEPRLASLRCWTTALFRPEAWIQGVEVIQQCSPLSLGQYTCNWFLCVFTGGWADVGIQDLAWRSTIRFTGAQLTGDGAAPLVA